MKKIVKNWTIIQITWTINQKILTMWNTNPFRAIQILND